VSDWHERAAPAKVNLALVVGPRRADGRHEVLTLLDRLALADTVGVRRAAETRVTGFPDDTIVRAALDALARVAGGEPRFEVRIEKRIPVAAGLGGGSSDAAAALALANDLLGSPLGPDELHAVAASLGADVPFFLRGGSQLGTGDGTSLEPVSLPRDHVVLLVLASGATKSSTADVYAAFDRRRGEAGFEERSAGLQRALAAVRASSDLGALPPNDLASSPLAEELRRLGALRADVTGAGPVVFALFAERAVADRARAALDGRGAQTWITEPG
jgi:4-diphosphocytidyl-2-C-methyl-D-erythritol kinase